MTSFWLIISRQPFKSWAILTVIWILLLGGLMIVSWNKDYVDFCLKFLPEQYPECKDVAILREKRPDMYKIGMAITILPPIITLLPILFWSMRAVDRRR